MMFDDLESYFPFVRKLVSPEMIKDEALLRKKLKEGYKELPYPVRLSMSEESFINFWIKNRKRIFQV
jgi:hypothetical protein